MQHCGPATYCGLGCWRWEEEEEKEEEEEEEEGVQVQSIRCVAQNTIHSIIVRTNIIGKAA